MDIDELIEFEPEQTGFDFKATQYRKENFHELLKDVLAMANAFIDHDRLIITGVKKYPDNTFEVKPIPNDEFVDSATYQKLITDNIEPDLHIDYSPHLYKGSQLVGVLKITGCIDKPYMMKKAFGSDKASRKPGESFVRKGTSTAPLMRKDIDRIINQKKQDDAFSHQITCYFSGMQRDRVLTLQPVTLNLPSQKQAERIKAIITKKEKQEQEQRGKPVNPYSFDRIDYSTPFQSAPYENRSLETLRKNLEKISETYQDDDCYELYEKNSEKINITIFNEGSKYLEDAVVEVQVPEIVGLLVADRIYNKPVESSLFGRLTAPIHTQFNADNAYYPSFKQQDGFYVFSESIGNLRHLQPQEIFRVPLRITIGLILGGSEIEIKLTVFGKNLPAPLKDTLLLKISK